MDTDLLVSEPVSLVAGAVRALLSDADHRQARALLAKIDGDLLLRQQRAALLAVRSVPRARVDIPRRNVSIREQQAVFDADSWTCRYCGRLTIARDVCFELQRLRAWSYYRAGPPKWWHAIGYTYLATVDHVWPRLDDPGNLVTACWQCQAAKNSRPLTGLAHLGWRLQDRTHRDWKGLNDSVNRLRVLPPGR